MTNVILSPISAEQKTLANQTQQTLPSMPFRSINPLVNAAMPLLLLLIKLKRSHLDLREVAKIQRKMLEEIKNFIEQANNAKCTAKSLVAARYCLCTALDEVVLATSWGEQSSWAQNTLLSIIQKETWGGERFFIILEEMAKAPKDNLDLLELLYIILSLGFEGKYYNQEQAVRDELRNRLFRLIMLYREEPDRQLSPSMENLQLVSVPKARSIARWQIISVSLGLLIGIGLIFNVATYISSHKLLKVFQEITKSIPAFSLTPADQSVTEAVHRGHVKHPMHSSKSYSR